MMTLTPPDTAFYLRVVGKIEPAVRMTQRSKRENVYAGRSLAYKDEVGYKANLAGAEIIHGDVGIAVMATAYRRRWDASNVLKLVEDALNGICYPDDKRVVYAAIRVRGAACPQDDVLEVWVWGV